ncbi:TetR/AcrR family transcriptional regulator [Rhodococcus erythropolis]|uniref:TetR/AcrR family transcriptional regulator n=1 Tax=Rhodococcus erythropolis TaxID=1833 RepID=UPI001BEBE60D|nr:TetR/AcrR family transcriptional regulator [Rhodococcus erythropolis]MBT2265654.1 TetR/AcrR family transcriptional regulator [Rhodococcus erythropolis]
MTDSRQNRQGDATRIRLLKTAERLFATEGLDAVSLRAVNAAAGLGPSSVHYHFGTKDDLVAAVLLDMGTPVRDQISANVDALAADKTPPTVEALVRAVTAPYKALLLHHRTRGMRWIRIVTQISQPRMSRAGHPALEATELHLRDHLLDQVRRTFPATDPDRMETRWAIALMGFLHALSRADDWSGSGKPLAPERLADFYEDQVVFLIGGVRQLLG